MTAIAAKRWAIITVTGATFTDADLGREFWKKYDDTGAGGGRARIMQVVSDTKVLCKILSEFDTDEAISAANFYYTTDLIKGLRYLEGETVKVQADGGAHLEVEIRHGNAQLTTQVSKAFVGYGYRSVIESLNLDVGGQSGSAQAKPRNIYRAVINFMHTLGCKFGTTLYNLEKLLFRSSADKNDRPPPLFDGNKFLEFQDSYDDVEKKFFIVQDDPLPCTIRAIDIYVDVVDED